MLYPPRASDPPNRSTGPSRLSLRAPPTPLPRPCAAPIRLSPLPGIDSLLKWYPTRYVGTGDGPVVIQYGAPADDADEKVHRVSPRPSFGWLARPTRPPHPEGVLNPGMGVPIIFFLVGDFFLAPLIGRSRKHAMRTEAFARYFYSNSFAPLFVCMDF